MRLNESQIKKIIKEEKTKILLEEYLRREVRNALVESNLRLDEGFFDKITAALGKLGMGKITSKISDAYKGMQKALGNDKEVPGIDGLMGPLDTAKKMADQILADMKKEPVTHKDGKDKIEELQEKVAKMMQNFGKFLSQKLPDSDVTVAQGMEMGPFQKKQSKAHQDYEALTKVWSEINSIYNMKKQRKDSIIKFDKKLDYRIRAPYKGKK